MLLLQPGGRMGGVAATPEGPRVLVPTRSPPLLLTKCHPPIWAPPDGCTRSSRQATSRESGDRLTLVAAPAGYGKRRCWEHGASWKPRRGGRRLVDPDEGDNDPVMLWSYVLAALRASVPEIGVSLADGGRQPRESWTCSCRYSSTSWLRSMVPRWSSTISTGLTNGPARDSMAWLVDHAPATSSRARNADRARAASGVAARPR